MLLFWSPGKEVICHSILINNYSSFEICQCPQNMLSLYDLYRKFSIKGTWCPSNGPGGALIIHLQHNNTYFTEIGIKKHFQKIRAFGTRCLPLP